MPFVVAEKCPGKSSNNKQEGPRALGRSPEEKFKGHSGGINRGHQGHNLNNFG